MRWRTKVAGATAAIAAAATLLHPGSASGHASITAAPTFGNLPNQAGGTGALGSTAPYAPGSFVTVYIRAAGERSAPFDGSPDTTVDVKAVVPAGWTGAQCGPAKTQVNNAGTNNTNQPGADVPGWRCETLTVDSRTVVHWWGPQVVAPAAVADSAQFFVFSVITPTPAVQTTYDGTSGSEGFIVDQQYASGHISHWIPNAAFPGSAPVGAETQVATGLVRTVAGPGIGYTSIAPLRILDSRNGIGWNGALAAGAPQNLTVTGAALGIPVTAQAVAINVTVAESTQDSFVSVYPNGSPQPNASSLNFGAGQTVANLVVAKVGTAGQLSVALGAGSAHVIGDVVGYFDATSTDKFDPLDPVRVLDSRTGIGGWGTPIGAESRKVALAGANGIPPTATTVVLNLTATDATADSYLSVTPSESTNVGSSTLNFGAGSTRANLVISRLAGDGTLMITNAAGMVNVIADVVGYFDPMTGDLFHPLPPGRILDSRTAAGGWSSPLVGGTPRNLSVKSFGGVRTDASAVLANVTVTETSSNGFLSVYPSGATTPNASTLNFAAGQTVANLGISKLGTGGQVAFATPSGTAQVITDVVGYFSAT